MDAVVKWLVYPLTDPTQFDILHQMPWLARSNAFDQMKRRDFVTLLGGAAAWPVAASAQPAERMRRIGVLMNLAADDPEAQTRLAAFHQGLQEAGWVVGRNLRIDIRWGAGDADPFRRYAPELVALAPDVILATSGTTVPWLLQATRSVPIVFTPTPDPVGAGFVESLAHPGADWPVRLVFRTFQPAAGRPASPWAKPEMF